MELCVARKANGCANVEKGKRHCQGYEDGNKMIVRFDNTASVREAGGGGGGGGQRKVSSHAKYAKEEKLFLL